MSKRPNGRTTRKPSSPGDDRADRRPPPQLVLSLEPRGPTHHRMHFNSSANTQQNNIVQLPQHTTKEGRGAQGCYCFWPLRHKQKQKQTMRKKTRAEASDAKTTVGPATKVTQPHPYITRSRCLRESSGPRVGTAKRVCPLTT